MHSEKDAMRHEKSETSSAGDRRTGSVGERPDLAGSRDSGNHSVGSRSKKHSIEEELDGSTGNDPGLGGE